MADWIDKVNTKYTVPEGLFKLSPEQIASGICKDAKDLAQAVERVNFYYNRKGDEDGKFKPVIKELEKICKS